MIDLYRLDQIQRFPRVLTAGAYVLLNGLYLFAIGSKLHHGRIPVYRLGGHREGQETAWQCAAREVYEEASLKIKPLLPTTTYLADGDQIDSELVEIRWEHRAGQENTPLLVVSYYREGKTGLSLMFLAQADELPRPSAEVKGLLLLDPENIHRLCQESLTLEQYLGSGGKAILTADFEARRILEPFTQLRLLSKILAAGKEGEDRPPLLKDTEF